MTPEIRTLPLDRAEMRVDRADGRATLHGYAAPFNSWSQDLGGFIERIQPGAFGRALSGGADVRFLVNHNRDLILGRNTAGTLRLAEDAKGLRYELDVPDTQLAAHYITAVERRDITGMSFRFWAIKEAWNFDADPAQRDLIEVGFDDVCLATNPAYLDTTAALRSLESHRRSQPRRTPRRDRAERLLRLTLASE